METIDIIRQLSVLITLLFLFIITLKRKQSKKLNWAIFYCTFFTLISISIVNYWCVRAGFWSFTDAKMSSLKIPFDILFVWVVIWGIVPVFLMKKSHFFILAVSLFWVDLLIMPKMAEYGLIVLGENWILGELILILTVLFPSYLWAYSSYFDSNLYVRSIFQLVTTGGLFILGLPFILNSYGLVESLESTWSSLELQLFFILVLPSLVAVLDLTTKGQGTPFPYDPTKKLVRTGVYAYCRNPIQWSFTMMFIPLSIYHNSWYLMVGSLASVSYSYGVSDMQEYPDLENRFGDEWIRYKKSVPKWYFLWKPKQIPIGKVYFDTSCKPCTQLMRWFSKANPRNLEIKSSSDFIGTGLLQVTYIDYLGNEFKSVKAIASSLEHINLAYASLGWFMRLPIITHLLQVIVDSIDLEEKQECRIE